MTMTRTSPAGGLYQDLFAGGSTVGATDAELLERYRSTRSESAFAALAARHGAMVWGVCRRLAGDRHDAEDAFQAVFLLLARKAGSIRVDESLAPWLHGTARRIALRARRQAARRAARPAPPPRDPDLDPAAEAERKDAVDALQAEIARLPAKYQIAVDLCILQGLSYEQAAGRLAWPVATVKSRLARGRGRLRSRLTRRGLAPSALALAAGRLRAEAVPALANAVPLGTSGGGSIWYVLTRKAHTLMNQCNPSFVGAGAFLTIVMSISGGLYGVAPPTTQAIMPKAKEREARDRDRTWKQTFPGGVTVEIVGVSDGRTWWHPSGTPLETPLCDPPQMSYPIDSKLRVRFFAYRLEEQGSPPRSGLPYLHASVEGSDSAPMPTKPPMKDGRPREGLHLFAAAIPDATDEGTIHCDMSERGWHLETTFPSRASAPFPAQVDATHEATRLTFSGAIAVESRTVTSLVRPSYRHGQERLIAVDVDGLEHEVREELCVPTEIHTLVTSQFSLTPDRIRSFRMEYRDSKSVDIPHVALIPRSSDKRD